MFPTTLLNLRTSGSAFLAICMAVFLFASSATTSLADPVKRGLQGAFGGAVVGGVLGGPKGAARGAGIGAAIGIISGAAEASEERAYRERSRHYHEPRHRRPPVRRSPLVHDIQRTLAELGYDPGPRDGIYGGQTADAISTYQDDNDLAVNGAASEELLDHMVARGG